MSKNKEKEVKDFLISERKKIGAGITSAPVWIMQKAEKRIYNARQKRTWKNIDLGKRQKKAAKKMAKKTIKSGVKRGKRKRKVSKKKS